MNVERKIKEMNDEVRAIKTAYAQSAYDLIIYTYELNVEEDFGVIDQEITFNTDDGSNALITIEGADFRRLPYQGGAKVYLGRKLGTGTVKLFSVQKGTVTIS